MSLDEHEEDEDLRDTQLAQPVFAFAEDQKSSYSAYMSRRSSTGSLKAGTNHSSTFTKSDLQC